MKSYFRADIELISIDSVKGIISLDAPAVTTNVSSYCSDNLFSYYICCNTWLYIFKQYTEYGWMQVREAMLNDGLIATIKRFSDASDLIVHEDELIDGLTIAIYRDIETFVNKVYGPVIPDDPDKTINKNLMATVLFTFRYPKRMTPTGNDLIQDESIRKFKDNEKFLKLFQGGWEFDNSSDILNYGRVPIITYNGYDHKLILMLRKVIAELLDWKSAIRDIRTALSDPTNYVIPTGSGTDAGPTPGAKVWAISRSNPEVFDRIMGFPYATLDLPSRVSFTHYGEEMRVVQVQAVPKSYKASRIIAMENTYRQGRASVVSHILEKYLPRNIMLRDQTINQKLALAGSKGSPLATIDQSNASDLISKSLFIEIFPSEFTELVLPLLGNMVQYADSERLYPMQTLSTAGNSMTFILECIVFLCIDKLAHEITVQYTGTNYDFEEVEGVKLPIPSVYGDDQIVWSETLPVLQWINDKLGFTMNADKSFSSGKYRESCGKEYYKGIDVSSYYYPRFPIYGTITPSRVVIGNKQYRDSRTNEIKDSLASLISLQHRLYGVCYGASYFLSVIIKEAKPKMTTSLVGMDLDDLWGYEDTYQIRKAPSGEIVTISNYGVTKREIRPIEIQDTFVRTLKYSMRTKRDITNVPDTRKRAWEAYKYQRFLKHGPEYSDPLLELLGISDRPLTAEEAFSLPTVKWGMFDVDYTVK